jgi:CPA1 family monovalent cation:H+ antiporter
VLLFVYSAIVGIVVGLVLAIVAMWIRARLKNAGLETVLGLVVPFAAYLLAEQFEASGVLAVVAAGFAIGTNSTRFGYETRLQERQVWSSLDVLLEAFVFAYMGLQLRFVIDDLVNAGESAWAVFGAGALILLVVLFIRPIWVFLMFGRSLLNRRIWRKRVEGGGPLSDATARRNERRVARGKPPLHERQILTWRENLVVSWTGMRGVVTLAAAAGVPLALANGDPFPGRAEIQAIAFIVAVGTLLIQGLSLPVLIAKLRVNDPEEVEYEREQEAKAIEIAQDASKRVFHDFTESPPPDLDPKIVDRVTELVARQARDADLAPEPAASDTLTTTFASLYRRVLKEQRRAIVAERDASRLDDDAARNFLEKLDYQEAAIESRLGNRL